MSRGCREWGWINYWGYNVLAPYAVDPDYASGRDGISPLKEFRDAVKALHKAGIEVIPDVVFNHTAELDVFGPTLCQRGIDNASYYWLTEEGEYDNMTGCGNALRLSHIRAAYAGQPFDQGVVKGGRNKRSKAASVEERRQIMQYLRAEGGKR